MIKGKLKEKVARAERKRLRNVGKPEKKKPEKKVSNKKSKKNKK